MIAPPHARAEAELEALRASGLLEEGRAKEFYIQLTDILRRYLEGRFAFGATRMTTTELARILRQLEVDRETAHVLRGLLERADLVKFARLRPDASQGQEEIDQGLAFVRGTAPRELAAQGSLPA